MWRKEERKEGRQQAEWKATEIEWRRWPTGLVTAVDYILLSLACET